jgi:Trp operon repressor
MSRDNQLKERWEQLVDILSNQFSQDLDLDAIIYLIGVQRTRESTP